MTDFYLRKRLQRDGVLPWCTTQLKKMEADGRLPRPVKFGPRLFAYRRDEFDAAIARLTGN